MISLRAFPIRHPTAGNIDELRRGHFVGLVRVLEFDVSAFDDFELGDLCAQLRTYIFTRGQLCSLDCDLLAQVLNLLAIEETPPTRKFAPFISKMNPKTSRIYGSIMSQPSLRSQEILYFYSLEAARG